MSTAFWATAEAFANERPPETRKIIEPMLAWGGATALLHGRRATGKTQIALSIAIAVARGEPWLGLFRTKQARVAFIQLDMPHQTMWERLHMLDGQLKDAPISVTLWDHSFDIVRGHNTAILGHAASQRPELVIVESLRKSHRLDENDSNTPSLVYKTWQDRFPASSFAFSHHDRKLPLDPKLAEAVGIKDETFRGSSAWLDDADLGLHIVMERGSNELQDLQVRLEFSKFRAGIEPAPLSLRFDEKTLLPYVIDPSPETALRGELLKRSMDRPEAVTFLLERHVKERTAWNIAARCGIPRSR